MKIICITDMLTNLTKGKTYNAIRYINEMGTLYEVTNNRGWRIIYPAHYFMTQAEIRDKKLEELGI